MSTTLPTGIPRLDALVRVEAERRADGLAALRAGCILEEPGGWYVPLLGGGAGWWVREVYGG